MAAADALRYLVLAGLVENGLAVWSKDVYMASQAVDPPPKHPVIVNV